ncbi:lytic transglycosylase domain-containing protein [Winogradskyella haliclonae]|uniref:Murein transglycosylase n=1 Tax=Winogradskyella haliclonae TaxID=2048558 RepID=A0ABQ2C0N1_9FLAO|nr:lytic transglycosylase domain-containing protein [Winogradskyella haliclonae]GGI57924.1 murein transglycosylase [Winogradskyella haliclonae]
MKIIKNILSAIGLVAVSGFFIFGMQKAPTDEVMIEKKAPLVNDYNVYALEMPEDLNFAGESVPIENPDIYERMDRELLVNTYWQSNGLLLLKRAQKYFPVLEPLLEKHGIPEDFKFLALAESGFIDETSSAGAAGMWHFMRETGKEYGLEINKNVDERYHIEKSTKVAAEYLKKAKERFGSWTLAAASYNAGIYGVSKRLKAQQVDSYYDALLPDETERYVFRILALKEIMNNPSKYGFNFNKNDLYNHIPTYKVEVDTAVTDFAQFAKRFGINYKILKIHNPWLREKHLNNKSRKLYTVEIPKEGYYK